MTYVTVAFLAIFIALMTSGYSLGRGLRDGLFQVVSFATSTGYTSTNYMDESWPLVGHLILFILMVVGASAGSTSGGLKLLRVTLAFKVAMRELVHIAQPRKIEQIRMNGEVVEQKSNRPHCRYALRLGWTFLHFEPCFSGIHAKR